MYGVRGRWEFRYHIDFGFMAGTAARDFARADLLKTNEAKLHPLSGIRETLPSRVECVSTSRLCHPTAWNGVAERLTRLLDSGV